MSLLSKLVALVGGFLFDNPLGRITAGVAGVLVLVSAFAIQQQSVGALKQKARQEKANAVASKAAAAAARRSLDPAVPGVLNPHYRAD